MQKIGIAGCYGTGKTILSLALSELTGLPRAHVENLETLYEEVYHTKKNPHDFTVSELLSMGLARFHSRIKQEKTSGCISDGTVLNELAYGKARMNIQPRLRKITAKKVLFGTTYMNIAKRLEKTIIYYAQNNYDIIYYLQEPYTNIEYSTKTEFQYQFDTYFIDTLSTYSIPYKILIGTVEDFLYQIILDLKLPYLTEREIKQLINRQKQVKQDFPIEYQFAKKELQNA